MNLAIATSPGALTEPLYHSDWGVLDFQARGIARCYDNSDTLLVYDTGLGKSHISMATAALLFEDGLIDLCLIVCEGDKALPGEWPEDLSTYTKMPFMSYAGTPSRRAKLRAQWEGKWQVMIGTYETTRNDAATLRQVQVGRKKVRRWVPGPLTEALTGKRVLIVYDEMTKLANRGSGLHKAHEVLVNHLRQTGECRILALTATPVEDNPEGFYNLGRILCPDRVGTVKDFEREHIVAYDIFGKPSRFKNLPELRTKMAPVLSRKRKTDQDVIEQFPKQVENKPMYVDLGDRHKDFYETVTDAFADASEWEQRQSFILARLIAGHPMSLLYSESRVAQMIVSEVGESGLRALGSAKTDRMLRYLEPLVKGQGAQVVIFTFFGQSILPLLHEALLRSEYTVSINHGALSSKVKTESKRAFRAGETQIFLTSDSGCRGINLPEASYVLCYELPLTYANYIQRINRIHRINSKHPLVTADSLIVRGTVEEGIAGLMLKRNDWSDILLGDSDAGEEFFSAAQRRDLIRAGRKR